MGMKLSGAGNGRFDVGQNADINVTPFVDVLLVLLIIFMMAIPMATSAIKVDLPRAGRADANRPPPFISIARQGKIYLGDSPVTLATLNGELAKAIGGLTPTTERVAVRADKNVPYKDVVAVLSTLQDGGFDKVGLVTERL